MNYSQLESKKENVIKDLLLELQASGRISKKSEDLALDKLGIKDQTELWKLIEESRKEEIIGSRSNLGFEKKESVPPVSTEPPQPLKMFVTEPPQHNFMLGTPWWHFQEDLPQGAYEWALSLQTSLPNINENLSSRKGGYQSKNSSDFSQIPSQFVEHIQKVFRDFPRFQFTNWWVNISNKGDYNTAHVHPGSDLSVIWYLTDNNNSLTIHNPMSYSRSNLNIALPDINPDNISISAKAGDFLVFPGDVIHSVDQHELDTPRISLSLNMSFAT